MSLSLVSSVNQHPEVDIVSIPGLPQLLPSYEPKDDRKWLREALSFRFPAARMLSFKYDFGGELYEDIRWSGLLGEAHKFLYELVHNRKEAYEVDRPIVVLCHSFGALILKQALVYASKLIEFKTIADSLVGVLFFGCIHNENHPDFEEYCVRCAAVELRVLKSKDGKLEPLKSSAQDWKELKDLHREFRGLSSNFSVRNFYETKPTVYQTRLFPPHVSGILCAHDMATLNSRDEKCFPVKKSHDELTRFPPRSDPLFGKIVSVLKEILQGIPNDPARLLTPTDSAPISDATIASLNGLGISASASRSTPPSRLRSPSFKPKLPCRVTRPHGENPNFVGRGDVLDRIRRALDPTQDDRRIQRTFSLCGLGGVGKTQTALKYVFNTMKDFEVVLFAHSDTPTKLLECFKVFAEELGLLGEGPYDGKDPNMVRETLVSWLSQTEVRWLLVFDNVGDIQKLNFEEFRPLQDRGSILVTSRDPSLVLPFGGEVLPVLPEDSAIQLLRKLTIVTREYNAEGNDKEHAAAVDIVARVGYLPLAICQVASLIVNECGLVTDFLDDYNDRELIEESSVVRLRLDAYPHTLSSVWNMSFDCLDVDQQSFLNMISFLDPDRIQVSIIIDGVTKAFQAGHQRFAYLVPKKKFDKCKGGVVRSSVISQNDRLGELWMHRLVQQSCHIRMEPEVYQQAFTSAHLLISTLWPVPERANRHRTDLWPSQQILLPHVQMLARLYSDSLDLQRPLFADKSFAELLYNASWYTYERGTFERHDSLLKVAETYCLFHADCELILADIYGSRASVDSETNRFEDCYKNFEKQYMYLRQAIAKGLLPSPSIREVFALGGMGNGCLGLHRYKEAEEYYKQCFEVWRDVPGDKRIYTANLGACLWLQGKLDEAEKLLRDVIINYKDDKTSIRTPFVMYNLGNILISQRKFEEAYEVHVHVLELFRATVGEQHNKTASTYYKLGWHLHRVGEYDAASEMLDRALGIYNNDPNHQNEIARVLYKKGCVIQDAGDIAKGASEIAKAENIYRKITGAKEDQVIDEEKFDSIVMFWSR